MQQLLVATCYNTVCKNTCQWVHWSITTIWKKNTVHKDCTFTALCSINCRTLCPAVQTKFNTSHSYTHLSRTDAMRNRLQ